MGSEETAKRKVDPNPASVSQPAAKRVRSSYEDILTIIVGESKLTRTFKVHKDLIANRSTYFKSATAPERWLEGKENTITIVEHHSRTFETYVECLYNPKADLVSIVADAVQTHIASLSTRADYSQHKGIWTKDTMLMRLAEHWVLGDYLGDTKFKNRVIQELCADPSMVVVMKASAEYIVDNTLSSSGLYKWLVERYYSIFASILSTETKNHYVEQIPPAMCKDVLRLRAARLKDTDRAAMLDCKTLFDKEENA